MLMSFRSVMFKPSGRRGAAAFGGSAAGASMGAGASAELEDPAALRAGAGRF